MPQTHQLLFGFPPQICFLIPGETPTHTNPTTSRRHTLAAILALALAGCATTDTTTTTAPPQDPPVMLAVSSPSPTAHTAPPPSAERREQLRRETKREDFAWQITREAIDVFGNTNQVAIFEKLWKKSATPEQWVEIERAIKRDGAQVDPGVRAVVDACIAAQSGGFSFVFQRACRQAETPSQLFTGIWLWISHGGRTLLQGRDDLVFHFVAGGLSELIARNGIAMAEAKEIHDRDQGSGIFDLDDFTATSFGAVWIQEARRDPDWMKTWADGTRSIAATIKPFHYGQNKSFDDEKREEILRRIRTDYGVIAKTPPPPPPKP